MKRVFRGKVKCDIGRRVVWLAVEQTESMRMSILRHEFNDVFGITGRHAGFRCILDIKFRLIGDLLPWLEWEWGVGEHQPNRLIIQNVGDGELKFYTFNGNRGYGRDLVCGVCRNAIGVIFPGLMETIGYYNACEVEVTGKIRGRAISE